MMSFTDLACVPTDHKAPQIVRFGGPDIGRR
jgi:hypothetical protein